MPYDAVKYATYDELDCGSSRAFVGSVAALQRDAHVGRLVGLFYIRQESCKDIFGDVCGPASGPCSSPAMTLEENLA